MPTRGACPQRTVGPLAGTAEPPAATAMRYRGHSCYRYLRDVTNKGSSPPNSELAGSIGSI